MNRRNLIALLALVLLLSLGITGCRKSPEGVTWLPSADRQVHGLDEPGGPAEPDELSQADNGGGRLPDESPVDRQPLQANADGTVPMADRELINGMVADRSAFADQTVYFDFDRSAVKASEQPKIEAVATYLDNEPEAKVQIEGHCDERGTAEYNRALGERRAQGIREYLINLGIEGDRLFTISYGEDLPAVDAQTEEAYAQNRRGEFVLLTPQ